MKIKTNTIKGIKNLGDFCDLFGISIKELTDLRKNKNKYISVGQVPKRDGTLRTIYMIGSDNYRNLLKNIARTLDDEYLYGIIPPPKSSHGFVKHRSIITNASSHLQRKVILNLDISKFFESIGADKVYKVFVGIGFSNKHSAILTELVTVNDSLTTGFPTSPVLANLICREMDYVFEGVCKKFDYVYTRYADDITISSNTSTPNKKAISDVLSKYGFIINEKKYKVSRRGGNQYVTGLTVCGEAPRLSRRFKRNIRLELYFIKKYGQQGHLLHRLGGIFLSDFTRRLLFRGYSVCGYIAYIHSVEPKLANIMWKQLTKNDNGKNHQE